MKRWLFACCLVALIVPAAPARAQNGARITGTVTEAKTGQPITGARVVVIDAQVGAITGQQGHYDIGVAPGSHQVRVSMIGYQPKTVDSVQVTAGASTPLSFSLEQTVTELGEVVVTGYGTQQRRDVTGAVGSIAQEEITQQHTTNAIEAIKGRVPGVDIVSTGYKPGDGVRVRIRGQRSIRA